MMEYKGYLGKVEFDDAAGVFHGEVIATRDVITFQGASVTELTKAFRESIDDYLAFCKQRGEAPDRPFSGQFVTRVPAELHRRLTIAAALSGQSLNAFVTAQLQAAVQKADITGAEHRQVTAKTARSRASKAGSRKNGSTRHSAWAQRK